MLALPPRRLCPVREKFLPFSNRPQIRHSERRKTYTVILVCAGGGLSGSERLPNCIASRIDFELAVDRLDVRADGVGRYA
jgi:hypothetical protein